MVVLSSANGFVYSDRNEDDKSISKLYPVYNDDMQDFEKFENDDSTDFEKVIRDDSTDFEKVKCDDSTDFVKRAAEPHSVKGTAFASSHSGYTGQKRSQHPLHGNHGFRGFGGGHKVGKP